MNGWMEVLEQQSANWPLVGTKSHKKTCVFKLNQEAYFMFVSVCVCVCCECNVSSQMFFIVLFAATLGKPHILHWGEKKLSSMN